MATVIKLTKENSGKVLEKAAGILANGGLVVYPTETSYGIGADALNSEAVARVHEAKGQDKSKPISVIVGNAEQAEEVAEINDKALKLIHKFMPGPLTLVCRKKENVPEILSKDTVALRISANDFARALAEKFGAITATSANLHGEEAIYSGKKTVEVFGEKVDLIVDAGELPKNKASTIYDVLNGKVLREGPVSGGEIGKVLEK